LLKGRSRVQASLSRKSFFKHLVKAIRIALSKFSSPRWLQERENNMMPLSLILKLFLIELKAEKPLSASPLGVGKFRPIIDSLGPLGHVTCWSLISVNGFDKKNIFCSIFRKNFFDLTWHNRRKTKIFLFWKSVSSFKFRFTWGFCFWNFYEGKLVKIFK